MPSATPAVRRSPWREDSLPTARRGSSTRRRRDQISATASSLGLTDVEASLLPGLPVGRGLWKVGRRSFVVDHVSRR